MLRDPARDVEDFQVYWQSAQDSFRFLGLFTLSPLYTLTCADNQR